MVSADNFMDVIAPKHLILPTLAYANQLTTAPPGTLIISGTTLIFFNGSAWKTVTTD